MRLVFRIGGAVLILLGVLWALQGLGLVGGSFMTGQRQWTTYGAATALVGVALFFLAGRLPRA